MIRKDYIQRYFDELATILAVVLQLKDNSKPIEAEEKTSIMADLQLESPVAQPPVAPVPPATGQVNPQSFQALFPNDPTGAAIAQRGVRRG